MSPSGSLPQEREKEGPVHVVEAYSGEPIYAYEFHANQPLPARHLIRQRIHNVRAIFAEIFLPQGYPYTVSTDYLAYQQWDTLQAFASSQTSALATLAVLKGVGVGNEQATVLAATLTWLMKDGVGMIARIVFAWARGSQLDSNNKRWRLVADFMNDASFMMDLSAPYFPPFFFAPIACFASFLRAIVGVCGGTTRMAVIRHQARRDNLADVAAKDGSQETLVNVCSLLCSLILLPSVDGRPMVIWLLFCLLTFLHLFANYRAIKSLQFDTLNQSRFRIVVRYFCKHGAVPSIPYCNSEEPVIASLHKNRPHLHLGCPLSALPRNVDQTKVMNTKTSPTIPYGHLMWKWMGQGKVLCVVDEMEKEVWLALEEEATDESIFNALFAFEYYWWKNSWPTDRKIEIFRDAMSSMGWSLQINQLNVDEWRFRRTGDTKKSQ